MVYKVGDKYVCVLGWISVDLGWLWGYIWVYEGDYVLYGRGLYIRNFIWGGGCIKEGIRGWLYWIGVEFRWVIRGSVRENRGIMIGLGFDRGVWFYCVCWDEVDNALRKRRGLPKNVNWGDVYKYKNS